MAYKNYLYFAVEAPNGGAIEDAIMIKSDSVSHFEMKDATKLHIFLRKGFSQEVQAVSSNGTNNILVGITITSGKHKEAMEALAGACDAASAINTPFIVVADSENSKFLHSSITACASIAVVDAS